MGTLKQEIKKAIASHNDWKKELSRTIATGELETPVDIIEKDTECAFGKWLLTSNTLANEKSSMKYHTIVVLHCEFHKIAGKIAALAVVGKKEAAQKLMAEGGKYAVLSDKLIKALNNWDMDE